MSKELKEYKSSETDIKVTAAVAANHAALKKMVTHTELRNWALKNDCDSAVGFSAFKKALLEIGINYEGIRDKVFKGKSEDIKVKAEHEVQLTADADFINLRFAVTSPKKLLWYGKFHENDKVHTEEEAFIQAAYKAVWLASKIKSDSGLNYLKLNLTVTSKDLILKVQNNARGLITAA